MTIGFYTRARSQVHRKHRLKKQFVQQRVFPHLLDRQDSHFRRNAHDEIDKYHNNSDKTLDHSRRLVLTKYYNR